VNRRRGTCRVVAAAFAVGILLLACGCRRKPPPKTKAPNAKPATAPASGPAAQPATGAAGPALSLPAKPKPGEAIVNSAGMKLIYIPPGEFDMGSKPDEPGRHDDETLHRVTITRGFWIGATEVTQAQWEKVTGYNPGQPKGPDLPANRLSWSDAVAFCRKLSRTEGVHYALPTEAQWEYACRAGSGDVFSGGKADDVAWHMDSSGEAPHPVAAKLPNAWGLYDMHGNAAEWCRDVYRRDLGAAPATDPDYAAEGPGARVVRGGSWAHFPRACRGAARASYNPAYQLDSVGLRVVIEPGPPESSANP